jgi:hypothetical protein
VGEEGEIPVIDTHNYTSNPIADVRPNRILRIDVPKHPTAAVIVNEDRPTTYGFRSTRCETPHYDIGAGAKSALDGKVFSLANGKERPAARDQDS